MSELLDAVMSVANDAPAVESAPAAEAEVAADSFAVEPTETVETEASATFDPDTYEHELVVDGQKLKVTAAEAFKAYQKAMAADKRFNELAEARKQFEAERALFKSKLQSSPEELLKESGIDVDEWAERVVQRKLQEQFLDPEELAQLRKEEEFQELKQEKERLKQAAFEREKAAHAERLGNEIQAAFDAAEIPINPVNAFIAVQVMNKAYEAGHPLTAAQAVAQLDGITKQMFQTSISRMSEDKIEELLGQEKVQALQKRLASKVKNAYKRSTGTVGKANQATSLAASRKEYSGFSDFLRDLRGF